MSSVSPDRCWHALSLMQEALAVLDETDCPADVGAHLDLAVSGLSRYLGAPPEGSTGGRFTTTGPVDGLRN